jgi:TP901 family phage tail tape measure protein
MADTDLQISFNAVDLGVLKTVGAIIDGLGKLTVASEKSIAVTKAKFADLHKFLLRETSSIKDVFKNMGNSIHASMTGTFAKILGALGFAGFIGTLKKSLSMASETEDAMLKLSAAMQKPIGEMKKYAQVIDDLEKKTKQEDTVLAAGLAKAVQMNVKGLEDVTKAQEFLYSAEKLSTVGNIGYGESVGFLASTLVAFNKDASESGRFIDGLYKAAQLGGKGLDQFAQAMQPLASIAEKVGINFEELAGAFSIAGKNSANLGRTQNEMRSFLFALQKPSKELNQVLKAMGGEYQNVGEMIKKEGFVKFISVLKDVTKGNVSVMGKIFDSRSLRSVMSLVGKSFDDFAKNVKQVKSASGDIEKKYNEMAQSYSYQLDILRKRWEDVIKELGTKLMPFAMEKIGELSNWLKANGDELAESAKKLAVTLTKLFTFVVSNLKIIIPLLASIWAVGKFTQIIEFASTLYSWVVKIGLFFMANPWVAGLYVALGLIVKIASRIREIMDDTKQMKEYEKAGIMNKSPEEVKEKWDTERAKSFGQKMKIGGKTYELGVGGAKDISPKAFVGPMPASQKFDFKNEAESKAIEEWKKKNAEAIKALHDLKMGLLGDEAKLDQQYKEAILAADKMTWSKGEKGKEEKIQYLAYLNESFLKKQMDLTEKKNEAEIAATETRLKLEEESIKKISAYREEKNNQIAESEKFLTSLRLEGASEADKLLSDYLDKIDEINNMKGMSDSKKTEARGMVTERYEKKTSFVGGMVESSKKYMDEVVIGFFRKAGESFYNVIAEGFDSITGLIQMPFEKISSVMSAIMSGGSLKDIQALVQDITGFFQKLMDNLPAAITWFAKEGLPKLLDAFIKALPVLIDSLVENIPIILDSIISRLDDIIIPLINGILRLVPKLIERIPDIIRAIIQMLPQIIWEIIKAIPQIALAFGKAIVEIIKDLFSGFGLLKDDPSDSTGKKALKFGGKVGVGAATGAVIGSVVPVIGTAIGAIGGAIVGGLGDLFDWWHTGGMIDQSDKSGFSGRIANFSKAIRAHKGEYIKGGLTASEVPIIGQVGEAVMNRDFVRNAGGKNAIDRMNRSGRLPGASGSIVNNVYVENMMSDDTPKVIDRAMEGNFSKGSGAYYQRVRSKVPGYATHRK